MKDTQKIFLVPTKLPHLYTVELRLELETRYLGKVDKAGEGTFIATKRTHKHLFVKYDALGICKELCERFKFRWVVVPYCGKDLWTSRLYLLEYGKQYGFGRKGFEPQLFLPLCEWSIERAKNFEKCVRLQGSLFGEAA